jgi:PQQ-dependent dehydrogenase (methanol/ethanol family)
MTRLFGILIAGAFCAQAQQMAQGGGIFASRCAGCHGADGAGGEHGPTIVDLERRGGGSRPRQALSDTIRNGIKEGGMPAFTFSDAEMTAVVAFVEALRAPAAVHATAGDPAAGQSFFFGKGNCSGCHMLSGHGGALGPDLTNIARERRLGQIEQALRRPETLTRPGFRPMTVRLRDGETLSGIVKNESNYDLQLQGADGFLHLLSKSQIESAAREPKSLMPAVNATQSEMRDLLAFLTRLTADNPVKVPETKPALVASTTGISFDEIVHPKPGNWPTYHGQIGGNRHIELTEIDTANVARLAPAWMFPVANARRLEVTPIVVDGVMYVTNANECYALDARSGREIWHYARPLTKGVIGDAGSAINRGVAVLGDKVFMTTDHAHIIALSRINGQLLWDTEMADYRQHYGTTSAPLVVNDLVLSGTSGGDEGARGFIDAYRANTGERVWRFWNMPARGEPGSETWVGRAIEHGCVDGWLTGIFDPVTNLIYWPTGNPCPDYNGDERKGDNLYASSVVALDPANGKLRWYFQFTPHDLHDWDAVQPLLSVDAQFRGRPRKLILQANRNGFFYVLDRITGEFLLGEPFVKKMDWADGLDPKGRPKVRDSSAPSPQGTKACPSVVGATNWFSSAYDPATGLFYVMALESCNIYTKSDAWWEPGKSFYGGGTRRVPGETGARFLRALDIQTGKMVWEIPQVRGSSGDGGDGGWGGVLSTAGGLIFFCDDSGAFAAADAKSGKLLWHFHTNQPWHASPMAYAVDGKEYVAVAAGSNIIAFALP